MLPTYFINHGGGPCFFLEPGPMRSAWSGLEHYLREFAGNLPARPRALLVISAHWQTQLPTINMGVAPSLLFDYGGFPDHTYRLTWPAAGAPELGLRIGRLLDESGIGSDRDFSRGWDHGVFVPMKVMFPEADIPVVQLSLLQTLEPAKHLAVGRALRPLREQGVLIVGSGLTYHNMRGFFTDANRPDPMAKAFDAWLQRSMIDSAGRERALLEWESAPGARQVQPHEDHLLPLFVAAGAAADEPGRVDFRGEVFGKAISGFRFG